MSIQQQIDASDKAKTSAEGDKVKAPVESDKAPELKKDGKERTLQTSETTITTTGKDSESKPDVDESLAEYAGQSIAEQVRKSEAKEEAKTNKDPEDDDDVEGEAVQRGVDPDSIYFRGIQGDEKRQALPSQS